MSGIITSSIGKKLLMSLAGIFLIVFLLVHMGLNLVVLKNPDVYNKVAHFMSTNIVIKIFEIILFGGFLLHIIYALILQIRREYNHNRQREMAHRLHRLIAEDQPYTFLYAPLSTLVLDKKIVMVEDDGSYSKLKPTKSGSLYFYFNRWKKLVLTPEF